MILDLASLGSIKSKIIAGYETGARGSLVEGEPWRRARRVPGSVRWLMLSVAVRRLLGWTDLLRRPHGSLRRFG